MSARYKLTRVPPIKTPIDERLNALVAAGDHEGLARLMKEIADNAVIATVLGEDIGDATKH